MMVDPVTYARTIDGWMDPSALAWLWEKAKQLEAGATWVELGVWKGRSWACTALSLPLNSHLIAVDTFDGGGGLDDSELAQAVQACQGSSRNDFYATKAGVQVLRPDLIYTEYQQSTVSATVHVPDASVDVVFIDADHHTDAVLVDLHAWWPKLKSNGILCGHDAAHPWVREALQRYGRSWNCDAHPAIWEIA